MQRAILNISWRKHPIQSQLNSPVPDISKISCELSMNVAGHCWQTKLELESDIVFWTRSHETNRFRRPVTTYIAQLCYYTESLPNDQVCFPSRHRIFKE